MTSSMAMKLAIEAHHGKRAANRNPSSIATISHIEFTMLSP
jgi:hypothetical protein